MRIDSYDGNLGTIVSGFHACTLPGSGYLSGSISGREDTGFLEVKDPLGRTSRVYVCLLPSLMVSPQPPSGCVVPRSSAQPFEWWSLGVATGLQRVSKRGYQRIASRLSPPPAGRGGHQRRSAHLAVESATTCRDVVREVQEAYGLHTTDLAELLKVSRQSVHSWKSDGGSPPNRNSAAKLLRLHQGAAEWRKAFYSMSSGWLLASSFRGKPLKTWLSAVAVGELGIGDLVSMIRQGLRADLTDQQPPKPLSKGRTAFQKFAAELPGGDQAREEE